MISVVVIAHNSCQYLDRCLQSIRNQGISQLEIIAVYQDSQDGTKELLLAQKDVTTIRQSGNGVANARNQGLQLCRGDFIAFLDADDRWQPKKLPEQYRCLQDNPELLVVTGYLVKEIRGKIDPEKFVAMTPSGILCRKETFERYGIFTEDYQIASDHEWFYRIQRLGVEIRVLDAIVTIKTIHQNNLSHQTLLYRREVMTMLREKPIPSGLGV
jgi:glycosyltransferase involved in cell wall biosynthesis